MSPRSIQLDEALYEYMLRMSLRESEVQRSLRERTSSLEMARMQISPEQGQFMGLLAALVCDSRPAELGPPRCVEVGTFTGYSALSVVRAVAEARLDACDVSEEWTAIAREYWERAGVADRIELHLGPAEETLRRFIAEGRGGTYDFAFVDADKPGYASYYEACIELLRPGGIVTLDNVLWGGRVVDPEEQDPDTVALRRISQQVLDDDRVDISMLPLGDGLTIARKR